MANKQWREGRKDFTEAQKRSLIYEQKGGNKKADPLNSLY